MRLWKRLQRLVHRRQFETDLADEVQFHRDMAGYRLGNTTLVLEDTRAVSRFIRIESFFQDLRYALRGFSQKPGFPLTVIATIGLALGLNTTLFTIANAYVFRPFAVHDPYALYRVAWIQKGGGILAMNWPEYQEVRNRKIGFSDVYAEQPLVIRLEGVGTFGEMVSGNYFNTLGVDTIIGRPLTPGDDASPGSGSVIVLSYNVWKNRLGADPEILGHKFSVHGQSLEVVGITRPEFAGTESAPVDFWIPLSMSPLIDSRPSIYGPDHPRALALMGRLKPGTTLRQAQAEFNILASRAGAELSDTERIVGAQLNSKATAIPLNQRVLAVFSPLLAVFALVLLIACANVANMMLARGLARQREIGVRLSLGAARSRLIRQLLTESLLLAMPASAVGFLISIVTVNVSQKVLFRTLPPEVARILHLVNLAPDFRVFLFLFVAALLCAVGFGLAPAIQATRSGLMQATRGDFTSDLRPARLRNGLVISQVTVCVLLLICAAVILRNSRQRSRRDVRLSVHSVVDLLMQERFQAKAAQRLRSEQWVEEVAAVWRAPLYGPLMPIPVAPTESAKPLRAGYNFVSPEYFNTLRIPLLRGRNFTSEEADSESAVAIISAATAARLWPGEDALGHSFRLATNVKRNGALRIPGFNNAQVIGIAGDVISGMVSDGQDPTCIYFPTTVLHSGNRSLLVRVKGDPEALRTSFDTALSAAVPGAADQINPLEQVLAVQTYPFKVAFWISSFLGWLALVLTVAGIYGVLSYLVSQRTKEIGIRIAMGASSARVIRFFLYQSVRLMAMGIGLGIVLAMGATRLLVTQLEMLQTYDALAYAAAGLLVAAAGLAASFFPSLRATRVDPAYTLRSE